MPSVDGEAICDGCGVVIPTTDTDILPSIVLRNVNGDPIFFHDYGTCLKTYSTNMQKTRDKLEAKLLKAAKNG